MLRKKKVVGILSLVLATQGLTVQASEYWSEEPEMIEIGQQKSVSIGEDQTMGDETNHFVVNGNGKLGLDNRENSNLYIGQGTVNYTEVNGGIVQVGAWGYHGGGELIKTNFATTNHTTVKNGGMIWVLGTANDNKIYDSTLYVANAGFYWPHNGVEEGAPALAKENFLYGNCFLSF